jgi:hypothetical protein
MFSSTLCVARSAWCGNMAAAAKPDLFILRHAECHGAILNKLEASHQNCAAFDAALALLPSEPR